MMHSHFNSYCKQFQGSAFRTEKQSRSSFLRGFEVLFGLLLVSIACFVLVLPEAQAATQPGIDHQNEDKKEFSLEDFEEQFSLRTQTKDLCAWERELGFFLSKEKGTEKTEMIDCTDRLYAEPLGEMKPEYQSGDAQLAREISELTQGFPIEVMTQAIARYDREIAGLIVGIGKKESNWGKRTPKLQGEECYNFWGYRGIGTRGFTPDGYGCWDKPEEAVKTIGDRLTKLREIRLSAEPARMIVWKCGNSCAGHSDESVRKWIADVDFYFQEIARN